MRFLIISLFLATTACGHRPSNPVLISQPGDKTLSCPSIDAQIQQNYELALALSGADSGVETKNAIAGSVAVVLFWPALFVMDFSNTEQIEMRALRDRNQNLERIRKTKGCPARQTIIKYE